MKKLYQYNKILIVFIFFLLPFKVNAIIEDVPGSTCKFATPGEKVTLSSLEIVYTGGTYIDYFVPVGPRSRVYNLVCVEAPKYDISGRTLVLATGKIYYPIKDAGSRSQFRCYEGDCRSPSATSYTSLDACMSSITQKYYSVTNNDFYATQAACVDSESTSGTGGTLESGGCYYASPYSGRQTSLVAKNSILGSDPDIRCSCATNANARVAWDVFIEGPDGSIIRSYYVGPGSPGVPGYDATAFNAAKNRCFDENTNRFYSPTTSSCYSSLDACKTATATATDLECTETQKNNLFLKLPPTKIEYTATQEGDKRTQFLRCVARSRTNTDKMCINEVFGSGLTSTTYDNSNFYRCRCQPNTSGILCTIRGLGSYPCTEICSLTPSGFSTTTRTQEVVISSPLIFIKVLSNFLFYAAIVLFIINFLIAGLAYVKSKGDPTALKAAQARITNSIGGFVFILLVGALLNYLVARLTAAGF